MENFKEFISHGENILNYLFDNINSGVNEYMKDFAPLATDPDVNHLTFYTFVSESLNPLFGNLALMLNTLTSMRENYLKMVKKYGPENPTIMYAYTYINTATLRFEACDKILEHFEHTKDEANEYLANGCKCNQEMQREKLSERILEIIDKK